jgi:GntR family transcriptional regulator
VQLGAEVVYLHRVREMDGEPVAIERAYLPHALCPGILKFDFSRESLYETLSNVYGRRPYRAEQETEASGTAEVARLLNLTNRLSSWYSTGRRLRTKIEY